MPISLFPFFLIQKIRVNLRNLWIILCVLSVLCGDS